MIVLLAGAVLLLASASSACKCLTTSGVNIRSTPCGAVIATLTGLPCYSDKGGRVGCTLGATYYNWVELDYAGTSGWVADIYLRNGIASACATPEGCSGVNIVSRSQWGARAPTSSSYFGATPTTAFVHHSVGGHCTSESACSSVVRGIQNYHMDSQGWSDIGYNFLIGEDGQAYEGRGWDKVGAQAAGYNSKSLGFCVMGTYTSTVPNAAAQAALSNMIECGVNLGKLTSGYWIAGHRDCVATACPGDSLYNLIQGWTKYQSRCP